MTGETGCLVLLWGSISQHANGRTHQNGSEKHFHRETSLNPDSQLSTQAFDNRRKKLWHYIRDTLTKKGKPSRW
jgi:hypothetical protein